MNFDAACGVDEDEAGLVHDIEAPISQDQIPVFDPDQGHVQTNDGSWVLAPHL